MNFEISDPSLSPYQFDPRKYSTQNTIISLIPNGSKYILDVGCNSGYIGKYANLKHSEFFGVDFNAKALKMAADFYTDTFQVNLNFSLELPWNHKFDCIIFGDILEHLLEPARILQEFINTQLEKDGIVILSLPNVANYAVRMRLLLGNFDYTESGILDKTHLHFYTFKTAKLLIEKAGLVIEEHKFGASILGHFLKFFPFLTNLLATSHIFLCKKI